MSLFRVSCVVAVSISIACGAPASSSTDTTDEDVSITTYVGAQDFDGSAEQGAIIDVSQRIGNEFADACPTTFCKGAYSNLVSLGFDCSVSSVKGSVKECAWVFAGSEDAIDETTGAVTASVPTFQCVFSPKTTLANLMTALSPAAGRAIDVTLPGTTASLNDGLAACFTHPIGATKLSTSTSSAPKYFPVASVLSSKNLTTWNSAMNDLANTFDDICGDTFCGSDYGNLQPLAFACSATSNDTIGSCKWLFSGSYNGVTASTGHINVNAKSFQCAIPVTGLANTYAKTLTAAGSEPAIQRDLPSQTTSTYDALGGCLP